MNVYLKKLMIAQFLETSTDRGSPSSWMWCEMRCTSMCLWPPLPVPLHPTEADVALRFLFSPLHLLSCLSWLQASALGHLYRFIPVCRVPLEGYGWETTPCPDFTLGTKCQPSISWAAPLRATQNRTAHLLTPPSSMTCRMYITLWWFFSNFITYWPFSYRKTISTDPQLDRHWL